MEIAGRILLLDDDAARREQAARTLERALYVVERSGMTRRGMNAPAADVILVAMTGDPALEPLAGVLEGIRCAADGAPIVVVLRHCRRGLKLELFERGIYELVTGGAEEDLLPAVARAVERERLRRTARVPTAVPQGVSSIAALEAREIERALRATGGNVRRAAALLGLGRATLYRRLATLGGAARTLEVERAAQAAGISAARSA